MTEPKNRKALETGSGITWEDWLKFLAPHKELNHTEMAKLVHAEIVRIGRAKSPDWWAQGVTVAYEYTIGRRKPGERSDGKFSVTVSATLPGTMDDALAKWDEKLVKNTEVAKIIELKTVRTSQTEKWRYWRANGHDNSRLTVNFQTKSSGDKTAVAVNHDALPQKSDVETMRIFWRTQLDDLRS